jgi:hypothetical protein
MTSALPMLVSLPVALMLVWAPVRAQDPDAAEVLAQPKAGEVAELDLQTIRRFGEKLGRFEVNILWADSAIPQPADFSPRRVRYAIDCEDQTMTLAAVAVFDSAGQLKRTLIVPPGAIDPVTPPKGSTERKWLRQACLF